MNYLVHVIYNLILKNRQIRKIVTLLFHDIEVDEEWITKEEGNVDGENIEDEQPQGKVDIEEVQESQLLKHLIFIIQLQMSIVSIVAYMLFSFVDRYDCLNILYLKGRFDYVFSHCNLG